MKRICLIALTGYLASVHGQEPKHITLAEAIQYAIQNSPTLRQAVADAESAKASVQLAQSNIRPQMALSGLGSNGYSSGIMGSAQGVMPNQWMLYPSGSFFDGNLALMIPLYTPSLVAATDSARWQSKASAGDLAEAKAELEFKVTEAYDRVLLAREMIRSQTTRVSSADELVRTTRALFEVGQGIEASVERSLAEKAHADRALTIAENDERKSLLDLEMVMGM